MNIQQQRQAYDAMTAETKQRIAERDAKAQSTMELFAAGYAATSGEAIKKADEARRRQADNIRRRIEAGEDVDVASRLQYAFAKADADRAAKEAETNRTLAGAEIAKEGNKDANTDKGESGVKFEVEQSDKATIQALRQQLDVILARYETN